MYDFHPYITNDGSIGLYNTQFNDIYHSATGALTEAYEKFVYPVNIEKLLQNPDIKILDICYGIGYNSKSFLNFIYENYFLKNFSKNSKHANYNTATIYTDNILNKMKQVFIIKGSSYSEKIHTDNIFSKIYIKAVDTDKNLYFLSPFIKTGIKKVKNKNLNFKNKNITKYINEYDKIIHPKINPIINYLFLCEILDNSPEIYDNSDIISILNNKEFDEYFDKDIRGIFESLLFERYKTNPQILNPSFLHNIYYRHVADCYKRELNTTKLSDFKFDYICNDARKIISEDNNTYDLIFLDAFTPSKCPCLWSYEFFSELYKHLKPNGQILTYTTSAPVRNAIKEAGFYIGQIYNTRLNKFTGTVAVKNKSLIKYPLSEFDSGLLNTKAGIFYRDENLTGLNEEIIARRNNEIKLSSKMSSTQFIKNHRNRQ